jgi:hypothetical protein
MFPQRNVAFYMRAAASFLRGTEDKKPVKAPWGWHSRGQRRLEVDWAVNFYDICYTYISSSSSPYHHHACIVCVLNSIYTYDVHRYVNKVDCRNIYHHVLSRTVMYLDMQYVCDYIFTYTYIMYNFIHTCIYIYTPIYVYIRIFLYIITKGSRGYLSSMYFSSSLVLGKVAGPFPEIESWEYWICT